jgi:hypothetical protein
MKQQFWFDDISVLIHQDYLQDFIPTKDMEINERLNAVMRFCMYLSLILVLTTANANYIFILVTGAVLTYMMFINKDITINSNEPKISNDMKQYVEESKKEEKSTLETIMPTKNNLFGNVISLSEKKTEDAPTALYEKQFDELIKQDDFPEQDNNIFIDKMSLRQFYKVPNTFDSESRKKFLNWCYEPMNQDNN